jgi:hypothetical protein
MQITREWFRQRGQRVDDKSPNWLAFHGTGGCIRIARCSATQRPGISSIWSQYRAIRAFPPSGVTVSLPSASRLLRYSSDDFEMPRLACRVAIADVAFKTN